MEMERRNKEYRKKSTAFSYWRGKREKDPMKILILNGSPKAENSNTLKLTDSFVEGMREITNCKVDTVHVIHKKIAPCRGCFACWNKTPGKCIVRDDMDDILPKFIDADVIIWSFPLYYFGMPSPIKALMDRLLPLNLPAMLKKEDGSGGHPPRYEKLIYKRHVLISTCGFYSRENNYEALKRQFEIAWGGYGRKPAMILCPEGELFRVPQLRQRTDEYLVHVRQAGREYANDGIFSAQTQEKLNELLFPPNTFIKMANASWETDEPADNRNGTLPSGPAWALLKQMAAIYDPTAWIGHDVIIEFVFTDRGETYQMVLGKDNAIVRDDGFTDYTTRIETPFSVWNDISSGRLNGAQAMMNHKYKVSGDFNTMLHMDDYFSIRSESGLAKQEEKYTAEKKTNMNLMLLPWLAVWIGLPINPLWGGFAGVIASALVPVFGFHRKFTPYDVISIFLGAVFSATVLVGAPVRIVVPLAYFAFGLMWALSCLQTVPLSAWYSADNYGGLKKALGNPLFVRTNRILTACWAALYLITPVWTWFLMASRFGAWTGLINSLCPAAMGLFTAWFQRWYPAKVAAGR